MIKSFRSKALQTYAASGDSKRLSVRNLDRVRRILVQLNAAMSPDDMNLPGYRFHKLRGAARYSVRITGNWRITFAWRDGDAVEVDLEDYH